MLGGKSSRYFKRPFSNRAQVVCAQSLASRDHEAAVLGLSAHNLSCIYTTKQSEAVAVLTDEDRGGIGFSHKPLSPACVLY